MSPQSSLGFYSLGLLFLGMGAGKAYGVAGFDANSIITMIVGLAFVLSTIASIRRNLKK